VHIILTVTYEAERLDLIPFAEVQPRKQHIAEEVCGLTHYKDPKMWVITRIFSQAPHS